VKKTLLMAASAVALTSLSAPALAQHSGHQGMTMPMPPAKKAAPAKKKAVKKKAAPKKAPAKRAVAKKESPAPATAKQTPADAGTMDHSTMDHSTMDHGAMPMPAEPTSSPATAPPDHSTMDHSTMDHGAMIMPAEPAPGTEQPMPMDHSQMGHGQMSPREHAGHVAMTGALGPYPMAREASGTAWEPDASEHGGIHVMAGDWTLMAHGILDLVYDHQSGPRGDDKAFLAGMVMGMARRPIGNGTLQFKKRLSPDHAMGKRGYPLLLASGETANGTDRLIDRQHPHDFFMELSASISQNIGSKSSVFLYGGLPGEPAFGPPAFMHRESIMDSPEAPITHHWLDSTHISFGVVTAGLVLDRVKVEVSRFNGREPDQYRWNIETGPLDSTAVRLSWNPTGTLSLQGSWGHFTDPEQLEPGVNQKRWSASALYAREVAPGWKLASTLAWGRKTVEGHSDDAVAVESSLKHGPWTVFGRGEYTENRELVDVDEHGPAYKVGKVSLGAIHDFKLADHLLFGVGGLFAVNFIPDGLKSLYGGSNPIGTMGFVRLKID
jgi:hypothetical protein